MRSFYKYSLALFLLGIFTVTSVHATTVQEFTKTIKREFDITANGTTSLSNKYGKVDVKTWNRNRVKIDITIVVNARSENQAQEVFDRIDIAFNNSSNSVKAVTNIQPASKGFWNWTGDDKSDYSINYEVFLPATNNLELDHRYGDVFVADMSGKVTCELKYANIKMESVGDDSDIDFAYGNGSLIKAADLNATVSYGKFNISEARDLSLNTKYAQLTIDKASDVICNTKYDDYKLGEIRDFRNEGKYDNINIRAAENVVVNSRYTQVNVDQVRATLDLDLQYGGSTSCLQSGFSEANLVGSYSDFKVCIDRGANYKVDASVNHAGIHYPSGMNVTFELEKSNSHELRGYQGSEGSPSLIYARLSYGGLKLSDK